MQVEQTKEQALSKERAAQSKILDLETQLSRTKTELSQLRRSRDDVSWLRGPGKCGVGGGLGCPWAGRAAHSVVSGLGHGFSFMHFPLP